MSRRIQRLTVFGLIAVVAMAVIFSPAWAGKKDDTLNIATTKELENADRYFNTAREGIIFARHVYDNLLYRDPKTYEY
jgi:peptide/nickel transport system substrate-binding protein